MRAPRFSFVLAICIGSVACGATSPRAVAEPRKGDDSLLFQEAIDSDAAMARAVREHYTKYEYRIAMRDGVKLFTAAYVPKDTEGSLTTFA